MTSPSSTFRPKLTDQEYLELVFENGQIIAKSQRSNSFYLQNPRTKSIMDLYEAEYNDDFNKISIHGGGTSGGFINNIEDTTQVVSGQHVVATYETNMLESNTNKHVDEPTLKASSSSSSSSSKRMMVVDYDNRNKIQFLPPDEQSVISQRSIGLGFESTDFTEESEGSTYLSSSLDVESDDTKSRVPARTRKDMVKKRRSKELYNSPERKQRNDINKKMRTLQDLLPNSHKEDNESLLDEAINYMTNLQLRVQMMTMGNRFVTPPMMFPMGPHYSQMGLATSIQMGVPQFLHAPAPVVGAGLPGISNSADMLSFLNHHGLRPMQNSALFTPTENCFPQSVPPSCAVSPDQIPNQDEAIMNGGIFFGKKSENSKQMK